MLWRISRLTVIFRPRTAREESAAATREAVAAREVDENDPDGRRRVAHRVCGPEIADPSRREVSVVEAPAFVAP
ncbi:hypothetical protein GCM10023321_31820 [Pseudonocardia eucalypti]|uniref:Uncharacterized protein n=1 Tax=Pseudonocardia eucalypti TaxID=648755 RepID=A0ABP9Q3H6_9PSEU|nr:hypothetical protein [Pseudonocardia eucalypti]